MKRLVRLSLGVGLAVIGGAKALAHAGVFDPMAAYWCSNGVLARPEDAFFVFQAHCWGCGAAMLGAVLAVDAAAKLAIRVEGATQRPARLRTLER